MIDYIKNFYRQNRFLCILELITFTLVVSSAIVFKLSFFKLLPLCVSLVVMFLSAKVSRYAFLLGGVNSILYAVSYFSMTLYSNAAYALAVSFPLQIITFINWHKKSTGAKTELRRLSRLQLTVSVVLFAAAWIALFFIFFFMGSSYMILDNTSTLLGIAVTILTMLRFKEYAPLQIVSGLLTLVLHISVFLDTPSQLPYVIFSLYSIICTIIAVRRIYLDNKTAK